MQDKMQLVIGFVAIVSLGISLAGFLISWQQVKLVERRLDQGETRIASPFPTFVPVADLVASQSQQMASMATALAAAEQRLAALETKQTTAAKSAPAPTKPAATKPREYFIYLSGGATPNRDWTTISEAAVTLDMSKYSNVREIRFEAGLSIINGEVFARLYDQTTKTPLYSTEVSHNTSTAQWSTSKPITLPGGSHYYQVQLRSSSGEQAMLSGARIKILAD